MWPFEDIPEMPHVPSMDEVKSAAAKVIEHGMVLVKKVFKSGMVGEDFQLYRIME